MDTTQSRTYEEALSNFEGQLSSVAMESIMDEKAFETEWLYLRHLPQMQPFLNSSIEERMSAAIHFYGDMDIFSLDPNNEYEPDEVKDEIYYVGYTDSMTPDRPLIVDGIHSHRGHVRWAIETAMYKLLHNVNCYDVNGYTDFYCDEEDNELLMPDMYNFRFNELSFNKCLQRQDELGDWLRCVDVVSKNFDLESLKADVEETTQADELYPIVYKAHDAGYNHIECWKQSGFPYNPCGQYYIVTETKLLCDMPAINPEKYLNKIFRFNIKTLSYEL